MILVAVFELIIFAAIITTLYLLVSVLKSLANIVYQCRLIIVQCDEMMKSMYEEEDGPDDDDGEPIPEEVKPADVVSLRRVA